MNLVIVSWNIQGKYSLAQLIDRMIENDWDLLIVLEPQRAQGTQPHYPGIHIQKIQTGTEFIYVLHSEQSISACQTERCSIMSDARDAVLVTITATLGASYRILTAHAPYSGNDGKAAQFQRNAINWGDRNNVDLILGDLNTYGSKVGSSTRSNFRNLSEGLATSAGGSQLDKALLRSDTYYGLPSDVNAAVLALDEIDLPEKSFVVSGSRASARPCVEQSRQGRNKKPDHLPVLVMLPASKLLSKAVPVSQSQSHSASRAPRAIDADGHCLYRCFAHILWGDQGRFQEVRQALAEHAHANWAFHPYLQHLRDLGQLGMYANMIKSTNAWGGEFELATLAQIYGLRITMQSPQGYAQAVYGNGATAATIRHTGDHFEVL